ncbi:MAG: YncE family protein [Candidatus Eiseniibacteriota bacterium]
MASVVAVALALSAGCAAEERAGQKTPPTVDRLFAHIGDFPLGAPTSRFDYQSLDLDAQRLYIAKMAAGTLLAVDIARNALVAELEGFPKVTGVLVVPELHKVYASVPGAGLVPSVEVALGMIGLSSGRGAIVVLDTLHLHEIARLPGGVFPDGIAYDPADRRIFVSDELGSAVLMVDADADRVVAVVKPGGEVGNVQYDTVTRKVFAALQSRDQLVAIDPADGRIAARYALSGCEHPHGLALAPTSGVGYVACDGNDRLLAIDLATGRVLGRWPLAHDPDVLAIDRRAGRLYVAAESGSLSSFDIRDAGHPRPLGDVFVGDGAHSVAVDSATHRLYFPLAARNGRPVLRVLAPKS